MSCSAMNQGPKLEAKPLCSVTAARGIKGRVVQPCPKTVNPTVLKQTGSELRPKCTGQDERDAGRRDRVRKRKKERELEIETDREEWTHRNRDRK